jgi:hypothetical protein
MVKHYKGGSQPSMLAADILPSLSSTERQLCQTLYRVEIPGKKGRKVLQ